MIAKLKWKLFTLIANKMAWQDIINYLYWRRTTNKFKIEGKEYPYLFHSYNNMGLTERSAEIPIIFHYLKTNTYKEVLEIGNVTNYYESYFENIFPNKTVVDKLEHSYNVITSDIAKYTSSKKFDFIFSISTFEHMDSDLGRNPEYVKGSSKLCTVAADNIDYCYKNLLADGGTLVITAPMGYTPEWDETFNSKWSNEQGYKNVRKRIFQRFTFEEWKELTQFPNNMTYDTPYPYANYIAILEIKK
jgi:hypothetical protein